LPKHHSPKLNAKTLVSFVDAQDLLEAAAGTAFVTSATMSKVEHGRTLSGGIRIFRVLGLMNIFCCRDDDDMATIRLSISKRLGGFSSFDNGHAFRCGSRDTINALR
jgi:hypothetical protein